ncbi:MAG: YtxH domain-containing protein [Candidatus Omnitrophica bacterium]|nr:YtxH domain-containing protein [Candidatus Omnitrophota bacterium]
MKEAPRKGLGLRTFLAFTIGAAAGSVVALLYAPASGKVTRKRIALRIRKIQNDAGRRLVQTRRALAHQAGRVSQAARGWISNHLPHETNGRERRRVHHATAK